LGSQGWDNRAESGCVNGIWLFYDQPNFNQGIDTTMEYVFGPANDCVNFATLGNRLTSMRFAGEPADYRADSITFYETTYFQGAEEYTVNPLPQLNLSGRIRSLIVTGNSPWTVYSSSSYLGDSICVYPPRPGSYEPAFVSDTRQINAPWGSIRSVQKGCWNKDSKPEIKSVLHGVHSVNKNGVVFDKQN